MKIIEVSASEIVTVVDGPVSSAELVTLAARLPEGAVMVHSEIDYDGKMYATWEL